MSRSEKPKPLPEDIRLAIERLKKVYSGVTHNISPAVLSRLPANVLRTSLFPEEMKELMYRMCESEDEDVEKYAWNRVGLFRFFGATKSPKKL